MTTAASTEAIAAAKTHRKTTFRLIFPSSWPEFASPSAGSSTDVRRSAPGLAPGRDRFSADPPVVGLHLFDQNHRGRGVFPQYVHQHLRHPADHLGLFLRCHPAAGDLDVHERHSCTPPSGQPFASDTI